MISTRESYVKVLSCLSKVEVLDKMSDRMVEYSVEGRKWKLQLTLISGVNPVCIELGVAMMVIP